MKTNRRLLAVVASILFLAGCGGGISEGTVIEKEFSSGWTQYIQSCSTINGITSCTNTPIIHPDCFRIVFTDGEKNGQDCVDPEVYDAIEIGSHYSKGN